jgi:O-antigen/teichoic acid export membrane protein
MLDRLGLPAGTVAVGLGLGIAGLCAYGFLTIAGRALGPVRYSHLSVLWSATFLLGTGVFLPLEQEMARAISVRRTRGEAAGAVVLRGARVAAGALGLLAVGLVIWRGPIVARFFDGDSSLLFALMSGLLCLAAGYVARGFLSGSARFGRYGLLNGVEGALRLLPAAALAVVGVSVGWPYALAFAFAPLLAAATAAAAPIRVTDLGPRCRDGEVGSSLGKLVGASLLGQALINLPVLAVKFLATGSQSALAGRFMAGVVAARVPVVLFSAVQAAVVPKLTYLNAMALHDEFRRVLRKLGLAMAAIGIASTLFLWSVGAPLIGLFFGASFRLQPRDLAYLAAASAFYLVALALAQGLIALGSYSRLVWGWSIGLLAGLAGSAWGGPLLVRVERGFLMGAIAALVAIAVLVFRQLEDSPRESEVDRGHRVYEPV